jgi:cytochrome P450
MATQQDAFADREETGSDGVSRCPVRHDFEPYSPKDKNNPLDSFKAMRAENPVFFCPQVHMWMVTLDEDVREATRDIERMSSYKCFRQPDGLPAIVDELFPDGVPPLHPSLVNEDPPAHKRTRKLANVSFTRPRIEAMRPAVEEQVEELLSKFIDRGHGELISEFSAPLPAAMFADIMDVPRTDVQRIMDWGDASMTSVGTQHHSPEKTEELLKKLAEFRDWVMALFADRRANPRENDFMTDLVTAQVDDEPMLTDEELLSMMSQFIVAGHETTRHFVASTMWLLIKHPDQLEELRQTDDPGLWENALEESLRHTSPTKGLYRRATQDIPIRGATIRKGDFIQLLFASANRDENVWDDPERFDIHRPDAKKHVAFGLGEHFCIGAPLARLTASIAVPELVRRMPNVRFKDGIEPTERIPALSVNGLERLDLEWDVQG